jgi:hypothetical protein
LPSLPIVPSVPIPIFEPRISTSATSSESFTALPPSSTFISNSSHHSFASELPKGYLPPQEPNLAGISKPRKREQTSKNTLTSTPDPPIASEITSRSMQSPIVTLTAEELLSISPELCTKLIEKITPSHTPSETHIVPRSTFEFDEQITSNFFEIYLNMIRPRETPDPFIVATTSPPIPSEIIAITTSHCPLSIISSTL